MSYLRLNYEPLLLPDSQKNLVVDTTDFSDFHRLQKMSFNLLLSVNSVVKKQGDIFILPHYSSLST